MAKPTNATPVEPVEKNVEKDSTVWVKINTAFVQHRTGKFSEFASISIPSNTKTKDGVDISGYRFTKNSKFVKPDKFNDHLTAIPFHGDKPIELTKSVEVTPNNWEVVDTQQITPSELRECLIENFHEYKKEHVAQRAEAAKSAPEKSGFASAKAAAVGAKKAQEKTAKPAPKKSQEKEM